MSENPTHEGSRYEILTFIGPCSQEEAEALCDAILDLDEHKAAGGGGVGMSPVDDDHQFFADEEPA